MNIIETHLAKAAKLSQVSVGQDIRCQVGLVIAHDVTAPMSISQFRSIGLKKVFDPKKVIFVMDHIFPAASVKSRTGQWLLKNFAKDFGVQLYQRGEGVIHQLMAERHRLQPGEIIVGADSHTGTAGGYGVLGIGVGSTEAAAAMATGYIDLEVPPTILVNLVGTRPAHVFGKDLVLHLLSHFGTAGLTDTAVVIAGPAAAEFCEADRMTICNMGIEMGAFISLYDANIHDPAEFASTLEINLNDLVPLAACPPSPGIIKPLSELENIAITQVVVGSCTNGRLEDMQQLATVLKGKTIAPGLNLLVVPASDQILTHMENQGLTQLLRQAGACITNPGCGPCFGAHLGLANEHDVVASTTNRNFPGRMGDRKAQIYLMSAASAGASALAGYLRPATAKLLSL